MHDKPWPDALITPDGLRLRTRAWTFHGARGRVLLLHGLGEHVGRYEHVAAAINAAGFDVFAFDQRGHGRSEGARGDTPSATARLEDVALAIDALRSSAAGPLLLLGHSLGGMVAARFVAGWLEAPRPAWWREVDGLVLSSPALAAEMTAAQRLLLAVAGRLAPHLAVGNGLQPAWISRDPAVVAAYVADPLVHDRITPSLARFTLDGGAFVRSVAARWTVPTLLLWAGADRCVRPEGSAEFAAATPKSVVESRAFEGLAHEIFNEPERADVLAVLQGWLARRVG
jgi:alpha-beta hydrolase superfamily lysophospholipase